MEYKSETKTCQNCKNDFTIEPDDFSFYEKIKVPAPTFCSECRLIRRLICREDRSLYKNKCNNCGKDLISIFFDKNNINVYCSDCWWGDEWDALSYGQDYDFSRSFFEQLQDLRKTVPREAIGSKNSTNCQYSSGNIRCKDCTLNFDGFQSINCYNCQTPIFSRDSVDSNIIMNADHAYETVNSNSIYNTKFVYFSDDCMDSSFLFNCIGCYNCFGCVNLRNKKYCIWNKQYNKEEYEKEIKNWNLNSYEVLKKSKELFEEFRIRIPRKFALITNSHNVTGNDIKNTNNSKNCYSVRNGVDNCKNILTSGLLLKDSHDAIFGGDKSEIFYETSGGVGSQRCFFSRGQYYSKDIEYCERVLNCSNLFGCVHLRNKKYCILNKQYTKEEYLELREKIIKQMNDFPYVDKKGRLYKYGEFFPPEISLYGYNETWAHKYFPLTKEEALEKGYNWQDDLNRNYNITIHSEKLPDNIKDVDDSILSEVIGCDHLSKNCNQQCSEAFRILPNELQFYRQMNLTLPRLCPNCRDYERQKFIEKPRLYKRKCMCQKFGNIYQNTSKHFHGNEPCSNEFESTISEDRKEIVYCEKCYQSEFI